MKHLSTLFRELSSAFLLAGTVFFFAPVYVLLVNKEVFPVTLGDVWQFIVLYTLAAFAILALVTLLLWKYRVYVTALYFGLVIAFTFQGNFPFYSLGKLDGQAIEWGEYSKYLPLDIIIWVGIILLCLYFRKSLHRNTVFAVGLLLAANVLPLVGRITIADFLSTTEGKNYYDSSKQFEFAKDKNVVVIVLDTFRSDAFAELLINEPRYAESFKDFTYFPNATGGFPSTKPSVPLILTGDYIDNTITYQEFISTHRKTNLGKFLSENGVTAEWYFKTATFFRDWANYTRDIPAKYQVDQVRKGLVVSFIRSFPLPLKQYFVEEYYSGADFYHKTTFDFYHNAENVRAIDKAPVFKYIHLSGAHAPYQLDGSFNRVNKGYLEQAKAAINAVERFLQELQAAGVYDNSMILIVGDHGDDVSLTLERASNRNVSNDSSPIRLSEIIPVANPVFLAKNFNQEQPSISESDAPVSLTDVPKTVADSLGLENTFPGYSIFDDIPNDRVRTFYYYLWSHLDWNSSYLPPLYPFEIQGNVSDAAAWTFLKKAHTEQGIEAINPPSYQYGENIMGLISSSDMGWFFSPGFSKPKTPADGGWTVGPVSCLNLTVAPTNQSLVLTIKGKYYTKPDLLETQRIEVMVDQERVASESNITEAQISIPAELATRATSDNQLQVCFGYPDSRSPKELGVSEDTRQLGYFFTDLSIQEAGSQTFQGE